jgi:segregation and condensation protein A
LLFFIGFRKLTIRGIIMDFEEFLPPSEEAREIEEDIEHPIEKIGSNQVYDVITSRKPDWQAIIYDLISSEQLDPWDIDLVILTRRYFEKISELEEAEFYISSKVLLAAALLLRIKSEFLLNRYIKSIDDALFGKKDGKKYILEKIEVNEDDLPILIPKTPLPRMRKVTLPELMAALSKAINTESRRIGREVAIKRAKKLSEVDFPQFRRIDLKDRIRQFYAKILTSVKKKAVSGEKHTNKVSYKTLAGIDREERVACFLPLLHLSNSKKLWLEQEDHLEEIWIYLYDYFDKNREQFIEELQLDNEFAEEFEGLKAEILGEEMPLMGEIDRALSEVEGEIEELKREEKIDEISGFSEELS